MGMASDQVLSLGFDVVTKNAVESYICNILSELPALPAPRYMHESVISKGKTGSWTLFVAGGKSNARSWENTVWSLDLLPYFRTGLKKTKEDGTTEALTSQWQTCAPMQSARSNFAMIGLNNYIYAYGGISGPGEGERAHYPVLATVNIECYTVAADSWATVTINLAPKLAAFSWCQMGDTPSIAIVGGTNGDIMSDETCVIDLQAGTVQQSSFEFNTSMGKMCYQTSNSSLHHIGGMNSEGIDYSCTLDNPERKWTENGKNHSLVLNATALEFCNSPSIYFY